MATDEVTIVICYQPGTASLLRICLSSIMRHTDIPYRVDVLTTEIDKGLQELKQQNIRLFEYKDPDQRSSSRLHGWLLDSHIPDSVETKYVLTLDSDCFPVADGWLYQLYDMLAWDTKIAGILHPWSPPPDDMPHSKIEWRVRSQHCWNVTHVACQMIRIEDLRTLGKKYNEGDDTGLAIPLEAKKRGWGIDGFKVTRCPRPAPAEDAIDPEFNRYVHLVFEDKVYHQGGGTRTSVCGEQPALERTFGWAREKVELLQGAEFLLERDMSYWFKFDREEEVAAEKMQRLFGLTSQQMKG